MHLSRLLVTLAVFNGTTIIPATAQDALPRTALVMGVGDYGGAKYTGKAIPDLPGITTADLPGMEAKLKALGFNVTVVANPTLGQAKAAVDGFSARIKAAPGVSLFYFSGHGAEYEGKNFLITRGASIGSKADLVDEALSAQRVLNGMEESGASVNLVFLDCCRNDLGKNVGGAEMAPVKARGSFIGFATRSGDVADSGEDGSPYTRFLLKHLDKPGISVADMYAMVIGDVKNYSRSVLGEERRPGFYSELDAPFYFVPVKHTSPPTHEMSEAEIDRRARELAAKMTSTTATPTPQVRVPSALDVANRVALWFTPTPTPQVRVPSAPSKPPSNADTQGFTNSLGMKFVFVPGTQVMMCIHETRTEDYAKFASEQRGVDASWTRFTSEAQHPVANVSYEDAESFCKWLSTREGKTYRLPTDKEWSAAVGLTDEIGTTPAEKYENGRDVFPWGSYYPPSPKDGNYAETDDNFNETAPVMSFRANDIGIFDLGGNVWEWCQDWYYVSQKALVIRGASYKYVGRGRLRSACRNYASSTSRADDCGFRCVMEIKNR